MQEDRDQRVARKFYASLDYQVERIEVANSGGKVGNRALQNAALTTDVSRRIGHYNAISTVAPGPFEELYRKLFTRGTAVHSMIDRKPRLTVGWATKIIGVYLKTRVHIGAEWTFPRTPSPLR